MELYKEILTKIQAEGAPQGILPVPEIPPAELLELTCYQALLRIKAVVEDEKLEDSECFMKIEEILCLLEDLGSDGGFRHDFG